MRKNQLSIRRIAFGGVLSALSLSMMLLSSLLPFAEYACPALGGVFFIGLVIDFGQKTAWTSFAAVAILSLIIVPNKESALLFCFFFGHYPILKSVLERIPNRIIEWILKFFVFNLTVIASYLIMINILGMAAVLEDFNAMKYGMWILLLAGNFTFLIYDMALTRVVYFYTHTMRPKLKSLLK